MESGDETGVLAHTHIIRVRPGNIPPYSVVLLDSYAGRVHCPPGLVVAGLRSRRFGFIAKPGGNVYLVI